MAETQGTSGFGTKLLRGDGGVGAGAKATKTIGTSNQQVLYTAKTAGTAGNSIQTAHVNPGNNGVLAVAVVGTTITVTLATDSGGTVTSTASDVVDAVNQSAAASALVLATNGAGNGSGLAVAGAASALSGGTNGTEVFEEVAEVTNISGPDEALELIDATHMGSPGARREYIPSLLDSGEVQLDLNFLPADSNQGGLRADLNNRVRRNFKLVWTDTGTTTYSFAAYVTAHSKSAQIDDKLTASVTLKITGDISVD